MVEEKVAQAIGELAVDAALVLMGVPSAHIGEGGLDAEVGFEQLGNLLHVVAEFGGGIVDAGAGRVLGGIGGAQHLDGLKGFFAGRRGRCGRRCRHTWLRRRWRPAREQGFDRVGRRRRSC